MYHNVVLYVCKGVVKLPRSEKHMKTYKTWHICSYCGHEGFTEDFPHDEKDTECKEEMDRVADPSAVSMQGSF